MVKVAVILHQNLQTLTFKTYILNFEAKSGMILFQIEVQGI